MSSTLESNPFWAFSVSVWDNTQTKALLLKRQNEDDLDINLCLFALWCAKKGKALNVEQNALHEIKESWFKRFVSPIRDLRVRAGENHLAELKARLLDAELEAEKGYQHALYLLGKRLEPTADTLSTLVARNLEVCGATMLSTEELSTLMETTF